MPDSLAGARAWSHGLIGARFLLALSMSLPATLIGARLGFYLYTNVSTRSYDRLVLWVLLLASLGLLGGAMRG